MLVLPTSCSWTSCLVLSASTGLLLLWLSLTYRLKTGFNFTPQRVYEQLPTLDALLFTAALDEITHPSPLPRPSMSPTSLPVPPKRGVLMMMKSYGRTSNNRIQVSEALGLSLLLGRDLVIPELGLSPGVYNWEEVSANLAKIKVNTRLVVDAPLSCKGATLFSIGGPYFGMGQGWEWSSWNALPQNFVNWGTKEDTFLTTGRMSVKDLYPRRHDFLKGGDNFTDEWGVSHGPPATDFDQLPTWWPYDLLVSPGFARQNQGMLTYPNLITVLEELAGVECLLIDNPFYALDWRKYPRTFTRVWQVLEPASRIKVESDLFANTTMKGEPFLAIHARQDDMCHTGCLHVKDDLMALAKEALAAPQCQNMTGVYFFSDKPLYGMEEALGTLFPNVQSTASGNAIFDQEIGVRAACFIGNPNSTFSSMVRIRRAVVADKHPRTVWTYTATR